MQERKHRTQRPRSKPKGQKPDREQELRQLRKERAELMAKLVGIGKEVADTRAYACDMTKKATESISEYQQRFSTLLALVKAEAPALAQRFFEEQKRAPQA